MIDSKKRNRLLIEISKTRERKSTIDCHCNKLTDWLIFRIKKSIIDCHSRRLTIILADSRCVKWKWNTFIALKEKTFLFSQIHDHFRWLTIRIVKVKYIHRLQRQNFIFWRFSLISRIFTSDLTILFCLFAYFDEQSVSTKSLIECQLFSRNSKREICYARDSESSSLRLIKRFRAENVKSSRIESSCLFLLVDVKNECEVYIVRHDKNQI